MDMQKARAFFFILFVAFLCSPVIAQEEEEDPDADRQAPIYSEWTPFLYARGDQTINISLGVTIPMVFAGTSGIINHNLTLGGTLSVAYNQFLTPELYIGGEVAAMAALTKGTNVLYIVPFGFRVGYQVALHRFALPAWLRRFELPFTLTVGGAVQSYLDNEENYLGFFVKPGASIFFRFNQDWSFGLNAAWWWIPQWTEDRSKDVYGNFLELTVAARYHF
ncbi:MAG: hypothetical protein LBD55_12180 [Treponema sp.]|nr:hypothetical protein [Treponema sp.]